MDLQDKIIKEIEKTGFPLELRVSHLLRERDYFVAQSLYYLDEEEEKSREIDIRALKNYTFERKCNPENPKNSYFVRNYFFIECKKSDSKPWVFLSSPKGEYDGELSLLPCSVDNTIVLSFQDYDMLETIHPFSTNNMRGRSYFEPFKNNETGETIFRALNSAVKSTLYYMNKNKEDSHNYDISFYYPLIIFDGKLFEAYLKNGDIKVKETDIVLVSFNYKSKNYHGECFTVPVIKESALNNFLDNIENSQEFIGKTIESYYRQALRNDYLKYD